MASSRVLRQLAIGDRGVRGNKQVASWKQRPLEEVPVNFGYGPSPSPWRSLATIAVIVLVLSLLPNWLRDALFGLVGLLILLPILGILGLRWWINRNLVNAPCPVCGTTVSGLGQSQLQCPGCGEVLQVKDRQLVRLTPPGTLDVQAVEVQDLSED
ncbi:hypothetical protein [Synechococcus elongatus]|uniref:Hydrogenase maturation nickel metallochaperone HypA n=1 Tax=Synechococcus elongatus PCC 11801 TaxID=2219813 RepID=A0AAN1UU54_SYNEL|nr:hypothetical protein [Synechococcus elongatus]